jgi:hypothetical protein
MAEIMLQLLFGRHAEQVASILYLAERLEVEKVVHLEPVWQEPGIPRGRPSGNGVSHILCRLAGPEATSQRGKA